MPKLTLKNKSATLLSLSIGQIGPGVQRSFEVSRVRLDGLHPELSRLLDAGKIDFWTDATLKQSFDEGSEALRGKAAEIDELQQKAAEIGGLRREWARALQATQQELKEVRNVKEVWLVRTAELQRKLQDMDVLLRKAREVETLLTKAHAVEALLSRTEEVNTLWEKTESIDSVLAKAGAVESLLGTAEEIKALHEKLSARVATPLSEVVRVESDRLISCSQKESQPVPDMVLTLPSEGSWLVSFETVMHSPVPAQGFLVLTLDGNTTERPTGQLKPEGTNSPIFMTEPCDAPKGALIEIGWRASKGSMRMTTRRLTAIKVSSCVR